ASGLPQRPRADLGDAFARVLYDPLAEHVPLSVEDTDRVLIGTPIDAYKPLSLFHRTSLRTRSAAMPLSALYWRSRRNFPRDIHRGSPPGHRSVPGARGAGHGRLLPVG